jgi:F-type H+-transporting ATPase subunit b
VLTAVVTSSGSTVRVTLFEGLVSAADEEEHTEEGTEEGHAVPENDLNPIFPEVKEVVWGFGAFVVLALAMRFFLFRKVRDGMDARYNSIQGDLEAAEAMTASARADVADYDAQVAAARSEAQRRVEAARATIETERSARLAEVNARIAEKRAAAAAEVEAAKAAARTQVEAAVGEVASLAGQLATGKTPSPDAVSAAVHDAMNQPAMNQQGVSA